MPIEWQKSGRTKAPLSKVFEYYMNPENELKAHPNYMKEVKIFTREGDVITWEQHIRLLGMNFRSTVKTSLNRTTNTLVAQLVDGAAKRSTMIRSMKEIPTGTELRCTYRPKVGV